MHGGALGSGAQAGNKNALKHGRYSAASISNRRALAALIRQTRNLVGSIGWSGNRKGAGGRLKKAPLTAERLVAMARGRGCCSRAQRLQKYYGNNSLRLRHSYSWD